MTCDALGHAMCSSLAGTDVEAEAEGELEATAASTAGPRAGAGAANSRRAENTAAAPRSHRPSAQALFCPNCGEEGHHVEYPELSAAACVAPRWEAYQKFPGKGANRAVRN